MMCTRDEKGQFEEPNPRDESVNSIARAHRQAIAEGRDGYIDPSTGYFVFTVRYLSDRGKCCQSGCRHCPYKRDERLPD